MCRFIYIVIDYNSVVCFYDHNGFRYLISETGHDPAIHGARLEDRFYNNDSFKVSYSAFISRRIFFKSGVAQLLIALIG